MPDLSITPKAPNVAVYRDDDDTEFGQWVVAWGFYRGKVHGYVLNNDEDGTVRADSYSNFVRYETR